MFKKITTATLILSGLVLSSSAHAVDVSLEKFVGMLVTQTAAATKQEISYGVQEAVLSVNNAVSFDSDQALYATSVTITDIQDDNTDVNQENDKTE
ncbi:hypothetical protein [Aliiglaciecola litoralis]|uniref:Uncharacterized protein n=1 Tax=Aliiglaciecola litoralis TaxID=582857 RepID=A0ABP3WNF5_9ALTE